MQISTIKNLANLTTQKRLSVEAIEQWIAQNPNPDIEFYLRMMLLGSKPEEATSILIRKIFEQEDIGLYPEIRQAKKGYVDFVVQENRKNPVLIELKALFIRQKDKQGNIIGIKYQPLNYRFHQEQVIKYLEKNDYLILTNLSEVCLFNRDVLYGEFEPYQTLSFAELLQKYREEQSFWDAMYRLDVGTTRIELENTFFEDLERWYHSLQTVNFIEKEGFSKEELIVLFLNKIIFIKTLEDYSLIRFNTLADTYAAHYEKWIYKGVVEIFAHFFAEIDDWFWKYYDTELFSTKIWDFIDKDEFNVEKLRRVFEKVLGLGLWNKAFGKGMIHYDYRKIDEDVFGKAYETFIAKQKKDTGIYYTHHLITQYMVARLVAELFDKKVNTILTALDNNDLAVVNETMVQIQHIKIADTCSGSGSFLIKVLREIYAQYGKIEEKTRYIKAFNGKDLFDRPPHIKAVEQFRSHYFLDNPRHLLASIILRHIFAIDIDERALDTAKTNLWKEAVKLNPKSFNFRLIPKELNHTLPNLAVNFVNADALYDLPLHWQLAFLANNFDSEIKQLQSIRRDYLRHLHNPEILNEIGEVKAKIRLTMLAAVDDELFKDLLDQRKPILMAIEFFYLYFDEQGRVLPEEQQGFDGIVSNPPWEVLKPVKKEFAEIGKGQMDKKQFDVWFNKKCKEDKQFSEDWQKYQTFYDKYRAYLRDKCQYQGEGDLNYFKLFIERDFNVVKPKGYINLLIPSSIQTDLGCTELRKLLIQQNTLRELYSFENRGYFKEEDSEHKTKIFPDVHPQFKFSIIQAQKAGNPAEYDFNALFYLHNPNELYKTKPIRLNSEVITHFSPENFSIMEFPAQVDFNLCEKILGHHALLKSLGYVFRREFHMTGDANYFKTQRNKNDWILYEGKMIHQFNSNFSLPNYFIEPNKASDILLEKEVKRIKKGLKLTKKVEEIKTFFLEQGYLLDCQTYRFAYRAVGSSTNERTLISSIIPAHVFSVHSINYLINCYYKKSGDFFVQAKQSNVEIVFLMAMLNSLTINYYIRNKVSANLTMFYLYELPIPKTSEKLKQQIIEKSFTLLYAKSKSELYEDLRQALKLAPINPEALDLIQIRAELEVIIAKLYGLNKEDWIYLTSTFTYGGKSETKKELDGIIERSGGIF
jgi:hypothetical protein